MPSKFEELYDNINKRLQELISPTKQENPETTQKEDLSAAIKLRDSQISQLQQQINISNSTHQQQIIQIQKDFDLRIKELSAYLQDNNKQRQETLQKEQQIIKRRTRIINIVETPIQASKTILTLKGKPGLIRELTVVSPVNFKFVIMLDDEYLMRDTATWNLLSTISEFSEDIVAIKTIDNDYLITVKNLQFTNSVSIVMELDFDKQGQTATTINNIFCLYDTEE